ncbi:T9SS type A sorting domain-containing protein [bacterium]|nr:T9SS type A sorting domain-containing protein [bacterium]
MIFFRRISLTPLLVLVTALLLPCDSIWAQITWSNGGNIIETYSFDDAVCVDVDNDGDEDLVAVSSSSNMIFLYLNVNSEDIFGLQTVLADSVPGPSLLCCEDFDGDADIDIAVGCSGDSSLLWFVNEDNSDDFTLAQVLDASLPGHKSVSAADIDDDGDLDLLTSSAGDNTIRWFANEDGHGQFSQGIVITDTLVAVVDVDPVDVDGDGDIDLIAVAQGIDQAIWYENTTGSGDFEFASVISEYTDGPVIHAVDLDADNDPDVICPHMFWPNWLIWVENLDGLGDYSSTHTIATSTWDTVSDIVTPDVDSDGDPDVVYSLGWHENLDGLGTMGERNSIRLGGSESKHIDDSDLDLDGDIDLVSVSSFSSIYRFMNEDGLGSFSDKYIVNPGVRGVREVYASDLDGDGDLDIVSASEFDDRIAWYENLDDTGQFGTQRNVTTRSNHARLIFCCDLNGDGFNDIVTEYNYYTSIAWYENLTDGTFGDVRMIASGLNTPQEIRTGDLDGDGDLDILSASLEDDKVAWFENLDGSGTFGAQHIINGNADGAACVWCADLDGDGDLDVLAGSKWDGIIGWYENDGQGGFGDVNVLADTELRASSVVAADFDGDGDLDVLSTATEYDNVSWYENLDGQGAFGPRQVIATDGADPEYAQCIDVDLDLDPDIVLDMFSESNLYWIENTGNGTFSQLQQIRDMNGIRGLHCIDINADTFPDLVVGNISQITLLLHDGPSGTIQKSPSATLPGSSSLESIYPNPFNGRVSIKVHLRTKSQLRVAVLNTLGQVVETLQDGRVNAGEHQFVFDGSHLASGVYFVHALVPGQLDQTRKIVLMK